MDYHETIGWSIPELSNPGEVVDVGDAVRHHLLDHIPGVHLYDDQRGEDVPLQARQVGADQVPQVVQLLQL